MKLQLVFIFLIALYSASIFSQSQRKPDFLVPISELNKIIEKSSLKYSINDLNVDDIEEPLAPVIEFPLEFVEIDSELVLSEIEIIDEAIPYLDSAETLYKKRKFSEAIPYYEKALSFDPDNSMLLADLGDMYYLMYDFKKAKELFLLATEKNFYDCQAHLYLSDACFQLSEYEKAFDEALIAHILNRNADRLKETVLKCAELVDHKWKEYSYSPRFRINQNPVTKNIFISASKDWLNHAVTAAVWMYEPGFSKKYTGEDYDMENTNFEMEYACFWANLSSPKAKNFVEAFDDESIGFSQFWYEIILPKNPTFIHYQGKNAILQMVQYLKKYH